MFSMVLGLRVFRGPSFFFFWRGGGGGWSEGEGLGFRRFLQGLRVEALKMMAHGALGSRPGVLRSHGRNVELRGFGFYYRV